MSTMAKQWSHQVQYWIPTFSTSGYFSLSDSIPFSYSCCWLYLFLSVAHSWPSCASSETCLAPERPFLGMAAAEYSDLPLSAFLA